MYDVNNKMEEVKSLVKASNSKEIQSSMEWRDKLPKLPIKDLQGFLNFEGELANDKMKSSMVIYYALLIFYI